LDSYLNDVSCLLHVGANTGQERFTYKLFELDVLWVEPISEVFIELTHNLQGFDRQAAVQALISDETGLPVKINIANNGGQSSSILELAEHKIIWPHVEYVSAQEMTTITVDDLVRSLAPRERQFDALVVDTQGTELQVLEGARETLRGVRYVKTELPNFEPYRNCTTERQMNGLMAELGFQEVAREAVAGRATAGTYFDVLYRAITP
jgi:FkbM family methyltransferase